MRIMKHSTKEIEALDPQVEPKTKEPKPEVEDESGKRSSSDSGQEKSSRSKK